MTPSVKTVFTGVPQGSLLGPGWTRTQHVGRINNHTLVSFDAANSYLKRVEVFQDLHICGTPAVAGTWHGATNADNPLLRGTIESSSYRSRLRSLPSPPPWGRKRSGHSLFKWVILSRSGVALYCSYWNSPVEISNSTYPVLSEKGA